MKGMERYIKNTSEEKKERPPMEVYRTGVAPLQ